VSIFFVLLKEYCSFHFFKIGYNKFIRVKIMKERNTKEDLHNMGTIGVILVMIAFLIAIFTAGYNDKPGTSK
jgi:hypothetical protein